MTEQSAEERARDAVAKWGLPASAGQLISAITAANLTVIGTDELAQLRAEYEALAGHAEYIRWLWDQEQIMWFPSDDDVKQREERLSDAVEPILARRRAAQEGE